LRWGYRGTASSFVFSAVVAADIASIAAIAAVIAAFVPLLPPLLPCFFFAVAAGCCTRLSRFGFILTS
jgi:hypothetical protein